MGLPVIVIGAGVSGLAAAKWLVEAGVEAIVLEARDRVGGRTYTIHTANTGYCDIGGAYIGATQNNLLRILQQYKLDSKLYEVYDSGKYIFMIAGKRYEFKGGASPNFWNPLVTMDVNNLFRTMDKMGEEIPADAPWNAKHAQEWDQTTWKEFINKICWTKEAREIGSFFISICVTSSPHESSLLWILWYIKQCGGVQRIISVKNGGQERKLKGGMQQVSEKMAEQLEDRVHLGQPVTQISQTDEGVTVRTLDDSEFKGSHVIIAIAPPLQMKMHYDPPLPPLRNQMIQRMPMGSVFKCILYYRTPFWREKGFSGAMLFGTSDECPITYTIDETKPDGTFPAIIGFLTADKARTLQRRTASERSELIAKSYARAFQCDEALSPVHYEEFNWSGEQYSGGCYTSMMPPGLLTNFRSALLDPIGKIHFAGTETASEWSGYINGGVQAGERAAKEILYELGKIGKAEIWKAAPYCNIIPAEPFPVSFMEKHMPSVPGFLKLLGIGLLTVLIIKNRACCESGFKKWCPHAAMKALAQIPDHFQQQ